MTGLTKISAEVEQPVSSPIMVGLVALASLILVLAASGRSNASPLKGTRVTTTRSNLGPILADSNGKTLYLFARDKHGMSACTGTCASYWPPLLTKGSPVATAGVKTALLGAPALAAAFSTRAPVASRTYHEPPKKLVPSPFA